MRTISLRSEQDAELGVGYGNIDGVYYLDARQWRNDELGITVEVSERKLNLKNIFYIPLN